MQRSFPSELLACISENRSPRWTELEHLVDKVWREAFEGRKDWAARRDAMRIASAAFYGIRSARPRRMRLSRKTAIHYGTKNGHWSAFRPG